MLRSSFCGWFCKYILLAGCLALFLNLSSFSTTVLAQSRESDSTPVTLKVTINLTLTRMGLWLPIQATVNNNSQANFQGRISLRTFSSIPRSFQVSPAVYSSPQRFEQPISVPAYRQQSYLLHIPFNAVSFNQRGVEVNLLDSKARVISQERQQIYILNPNDLSLGILSDNQQGFEAIQNVTLPNRASSIVLNQLDASNLPDMAAVLQNFEVIILSNFSSAKLTSTQLQALRTWINQGGVLVVAGGDSWQRTLNGLPPDLLPVIPQRTMLLPAHTLLSPSGAREKNRASLETTDTELPVSTTILRTQNNTTIGDVLLSSDIAPLIVQSRLGQGQIYYLAFDPATPQLKNWPGLTNWWQSFLQRILGEQLLLPSGLPSYNSGPGGLLTRAGLLQILEPDVWPSPWLLLTLLLGYVLLLGPVRFLLIKRMRRPYWSWYIALSMMLICSLVFYGLAFYQKGASLISNSISILQFDENASYAHVTTFTGIYIPNAGDVQVQLPTKVLPQPITPLDISSTFTESNTPTPVTYLHNGTSVQFSNSERWTSHTIVSEQDRNLQGTITSHLTFHQQKLSGTITNTLDVGVKDAYILMDHAIAALGTLPAHSTRNINIVLQPTNPDHLRLANTIAQMNGLPSNYFPYEHHDQPTNELQRHIAQLSALDGIGYTFIPCNDSCTDQAVINLHKQSIIMLNPISSAHIPFISNSDPLLLEGSNGTLLGWADHPVGNDNKIRIDGQEPAGFHDNILQVPLSIGVLAPSQLPSGLLNGHVVKTTGSFTQMLLPGIYSMSAGSLDFDLSLFNSVQGNINTFTLTIPHETLHGTSLTSPIDNSKTFLYNWQTSSWDPFAVHKDTLMVTNMAAYLSPNGHVQLRIAHVQADEVLYLVQPWISNITTEKVEA